MRILFVCLGNICRSPIAEGILKNFAQQQELDWDIQSAGTESFHCGEPPHEISQFVCHQHGIDISEQRAMKIKKSDLQNYDRIYAMAKNIYEEILTLCDNQRYVPQSRTLETTSGIAAELRGITPPACFAAGLKNLTLLRHVDFSNKTVAFKVDLFLNELYPGRNLSVKDPWYGGLDGYQEVYKQIEQGCKAIIKNYFRNQ